MTNPSTSPLWGASSESFKAWVCKAHHKVHYIKWEHWWSASFCLWCGNTPEWLEENGHFPFVIVNLDSDKENERSYLHLGPRPGPYQPNKGRYIPYLSPTQLHHLDKYLQEDYRKTL